MALIAECEVITDLFSLQIYLTVVMHLLSKFHLHSFRTSRVLRKGHILATGYRDKKECQKATFNGLKAFLWFQNPSLAHSE